MIDKEEWTEVDTTSSEKEEDKVEFEVEEEEVKVQPKEEVKVETEAKAEPVPKEAEEPQELDGIETKGAQKRIRQLIKQRKDRDDQISQLLQPMKKEIQERY